MPTYLTEKEFKTITDHFDEILHTIEKYIANWNDSIPRIDRRVKNYTYEGEGNPPFNFNEKDVQMQDFSQRYQAPIQDALDFIVNRNNEVKKIDKENTESQKDMMKKITGDGSGDGSGNGNVIDPKARNKLIDDTTEKNIYLIPATALAGLPASQKTELREKLKLLGFSDEEIKDLMDGKTSVNKITLEKLSENLPELKEKYPEFCERIEKELGISLFNEDGTVNNDALAVLMAASEKALGIKIDLAEGSEFRKTIDTMKAQLEAAYKEDPSIREQFIEMCGIDPFDENGNADINKLALIKMLDSLYAKDENPENGLDLGKYEVENPTIPPVQAVYGVPSPPGDSGVIVGVEQPTTPIGEIPAQPVYGVPTPPGQQGLTGTTTPVATEAPTQQQSVGQQSTGGVNYRVDEGSSPADASVKEDAATAAAKATLSDQALKAIAVGASFQKPVVPSIPKSVPAPQVIKKKGASAGVLAAAALAAGGSIAGGGILLGKKLQAIRFNKDNWLSLEIELQSIIESLMRMVGFTEEEIEKLETSNFKIPASELNSHKAKVEEAVKESIEIEESLLGLYGYSMFDDAGNVDDYLLFVTMIIDGKNAIDEYNLYDIVNTGLSNPNDADLGYSGIGMEDYLDFDNKKDEDDGKLKPNMVASEAPQQTKTQPKEELELDSFEPYTSPDLNDGESPSQGFSPDDAKTSTGIETTEQAQKWLADVGVL